MIHFKYGDVSHLCNLDGCSTLPTFNDLVSEIRGNGSSNIVSLRFGSCYELPSHPSGWKRVTYLVGTTRNGTSVTVGVCDCRPLSFGQTIF